MTFFVVFFQCERTEFLTARILVQKLPVRNLSDQIFMDSDCLLKNLLYICSVTETVVAIIQSVYADSICGESGQFNWTMEAERRLTEYVLSLRAHYITLESSYPVCPLGVQASPQASMMAHFLFRHQQ